MGHAVFGLSVFEGSPPFSHLLYHLLSCSFSLAEPLDSSLLTEYILRVASDRCEAVKNFLLFNSSLARIESVLNSTTTMLFAQVKTQAHNDADRIYVCMGEPVAKKVILK